MYFRFSLLSLILIMGCGNSVWSKSIHVPDEELARETVLPKFDSIISVRNRKIVLGKKIEFTLGAGINLREALYKDGVLSGAFYYNVSETHAFGLSGLYMQQGLSRMGESLKAGKGIDGGITFDPSLAPTVENIIMGEYQMTAYYGKISFTKQSVMNLSLYGLLGIGQVSYGDYQSVAVSLGFGQKFYFSKHLALRWDLRFIGYSGPNAIQTQPLLHRDDDPVSSSELEKDLFFPSILNVGIEFII